MTAANLVVLVGFGLLAHVDPGAAHIVMLPVLLALRRAPAMTIKMVTMPQR
jgi:hypothetical protein